MGASKFAKFRIFEVCGLEIYGPIYVEIFHGASTTASTSASPDAQAQVQVLKQQVQVQVPDSQVQALDFCA